MTVEDLFRNIAFPLLRFGVYASSVFLVGLAVIVPLVLRPSFNVLDVDAWSQSRRRAARRMEELVKAALLACGASTVLILILQAALVSELGTGEVAPSSFEAVVETTFGQWTIARLLVLAALAILLVGKVAASALAGSDGAPSERSPRAWWVTWIVLGIGLLATSTFSGHATVATPKWLSVTNDLIHQTAASIWFAGIVVLAVILPAAWRGRSALDRLALLTPNVTRFSMVALWSMAVVAVSGTINSFLHVGAFSDLWTTSYGQALFFKLGLFGFVMGLGALNHFVVRGQLTEALTSGQETTAQLVFRRTIAIEVALAFGIVAATALLTYLSRTA